MPIFQDPNQILIFAGLIGIGLELVLGVQTGFDLAILGTILLLGGGAGLITMDFSVALIISVILSAAYIFFGRRLIRRRITVITHKTNIDKLVGSVAVVVRSITPDTPGLVRLDDEDWRAESHEVLYEKDKVEILGVSGVTLKVKKHSGT